MIFRGSTKTDDWVFGRGKQDYLRDNNAIMRNIKTKLLTFYSECFFDTTVGVPWFSVLGQKESTPLLLAVKAAILDCYGVVRVTDVQFDVDVNRKLTVTYYVDTIFSTGASGSITP
jgi:hypothetical protein